MRRRAGVGGRQRQRGAAVRACDSHCYTGALEAKFEASARSLLLVRPARTGDQARSSQIGGIRCGYSSGRSAGRRRTQSWALHPELLAYQVALFVVLIPVLHPAGQSTTRKHWHFLLSFFFLSSFLCLLLFFCLSIFFVLFLSVCFVCFVFWLYMLAVRRATMYDAQCFDCALLPLFCLTFARHLLWRRLAVIVCLCLALGWGRCWPALQCDGMGRSGRCCRFRRCCRPVVAALLRALRGHHDPG